MARIEGTGAPEQKRRRRLPKLDFNQVAVVAVLSPVVILARSEPLVVAILLPIVLLAAYIAGYYAGRAALSRQIILDEYRRSKGEGRDGRRDDPAA